MTNFICVYCKKVFSGSRGKVPCPHCGYQKPCSGHRVVSDMEMELLKKRYPQTLKKKSNPRKGSYGKNIKKGSS